MFHHPEQILFPHFLFEYLRQFFKFEYIWCRLLTRFSLVWWTEKHEDPEGRISDANHAMFAHNGDVQSSWIDRDSPVRSDFRSNTWLDIRQHSRHINRRNFRYHNRHIIRHNFWCNNRHYIRYHIRNKSRTTRQGSRNKTLVNVCERYIIMPISFFLQMRHCLPFPISSRVT